MAKVSLRIYNREIENLVDQGQTDEAIAHCRHILRTFPKHLETYRLLGKAYLEARRYGEAVDIFGRVLVSVPDDFVSHVGMSIINDEQNQLDNSIWHMERAFESQPSNAAIQGELQRLYARRDGMEPPKVRMTRGALAHMYVQGELYPQAIAEIRAVLNQDSQRTDMQVLLAKAYFKSGQKADASDMCSQLLKKSMYCFDANRIMIELLPATASSAESTQVYRMRVGELDPYTNFSKESVFRSNEVPDASVNLEKLDYKGQEVPIGQEWSSSLGIKLSDGIGVAGSLGASSSDEPDWLKAAASPGPQADIFPSSQTAANSGNDEIPDFLRAAGWGESSGPEQPNSIFDSPDQSSASGEDLVSASLPDWLKGQAPVESNVASIESAAEPAADMDWLNGLTAAAQSNPQAVNHGDMPDWLAGSSNDAQTPSIQSGDTPDWLSGLGAVESQPVSDAAAIPDFLSDANASPLDAGLGTPDWLSGLGGTEAQPAASQSSDVPDWLAGLGAAESAAPAVAKDDSVPDWLSGLDSSSASSPAVNQAQPSEVPDWLAGLDSSTPAVAGSSSPDWLSGFDEQAPAADQAAQPVSSNIELLGSSAQEQDDAVAWLESLAAKHGAKPEELVTDPAKRSENAPDWVKQATVANEAQAPQTPSTIRFDDSLGSTAQEQDDAVAWLESLAAKHGAKPEELVTDPNKRSETAPDWVKQATAANESQAPQSPSTIRFDDSLGFAESNEKQAAPQPSASIESLGSSAEEQDDAVAWLESLAAKHGAKPEELVTDPNKRSNIAPDWVQQATTIAESQPASAPPENIQASENALNIGEQFFAEFENASSAPANDETGMWLKGLDEKEKQNEAPVQQTGIPDWLSADQPSSTAESNDLPNWSNDNQPSPKQPEYISENLSQDDLSNWLSNLEDPNPQFDSKPAIAAKQDLPDWLSGVESNNEPEKDDWKAPVEPVVDSKPASQPTEEPAPAKLTSDLPDWLQGVDETAEVQSEDEHDAPPWLHRESWEAEERTIEPTPIKSSDWHPIEPAKQPTPKEEPKQTPVRQVQQPIMSNQEEVPPVSVQPKPQASKQQIKKSVTKPESVGTTVVLTQAKGELDRGDIPTALDHYGKLIKKGKHLEETIRDLTDSLYRYPVEVGIWQTLGDAYMRANRLKEALESYNKAEELIR